MLISTINKDYLLEEVTICGRICNIRAGKNIIFVEIYDKNIFNTIQIITFKNNLTLFTKVSTLRFHDYICATGSVHENNKIFELHCQSITTLSNKTDDTRYVLQPKQQSLSFLRSNEPIRLRVKLYQAIFLIKYEIRKTINLFFFEHNFTRLTPPVITPFDAEGAGEVFKIDNSVEFFGSNAFLTVSSQFYAESMAQIFGSVYSFGPTFRADNSKTTRHAAEFWMLEPEWITSNLEEIIDLIEKLIKFIATRVLKRCSEQLKYCSEYYNLDLVKRINLLISNRFCRISYRKAIVDLNQYYKSHSKLNDKSLLIFGDKVSKEQELILCKNIYQNAVFISDYPASQKAFYMPVNQKDKTTSSVDLLFPEIGEVAGGSLREPCYQNLVTQLENKGISENVLSWYLELRNQKYVQTGGFGLGLARIVMYFTGSTNITDVIIFPRMKDHLHT